MPLQVFISYSHRDAGALRRLRVHLVPLEREGVTFWYDENILPGGDITPEIRREMRRSRIFVALASPDYLASDYCFNKEYLPAMRRAARKTAHVVVALIKRCGWKRSRMARYKLLPNDGKAVYDWQRREHAYEDIVEGLRRVVTAVQAEAPSPRKAPSGRPKSSKPSARAATTTAIGRKRSSTGKAAGPSKAPKRSPAKTPGRAPALPRKTSRKPRQGASRPRPRRPAVKERKGS